VIPASFDYARPGSVEEAVGLLAEHGEDAKVLAGGHSLLPIMKLRLAAPALLVDVGRLDDLRYLRTDGDEVAIGALSRHVDLLSSQLLQTEVPLLAHTAGLVGDQQIRNRGTIGGSLVHGDPAGDLPTAVLALGATLVLRGPDGSRTVPATEFFTGFMQTAIHPEELLVEIRAPRCPTDRWGYQKFVRRANDWAVVAAAAVDGRVALAGMAQTPVRAVATEQALASGASDADAAQLADQDTSPAADLHASEAYRRHLARLLTRRALAGATGRA
jgi:carbon-monoxide dehydrogenase medium subunit